ncbi:hypothetical protein ANN_10120, partial [Periplaneta americana]
QVYVILTHLPLRFGERKTRLSRSEGARALVERCLCSVSIIKALVFLNRHMRRARCEARLAQIRTTREIVSGFYGCKENKVLVAHDYDGKTTSESERTGIGLP